MPELNNRQDKIVLMQSYMHTKMIDLFIGQKNKKTEVQRNSRGFEEILFVKIIRNTKDISKNDKENFDGCVIAVKDAMQFRRIVDKSSNIFNKIIVLGTTNEINRMVLEHKKIFALLNPDYERKKDFLDSRNSGLNHVLCKIALKNKKTILISFDCLKNEKSLGRTIQNFRLCKKFKTKIQLVNFCDESSINKIKNAFELKEVERVLMNTEHFNRGDLMIN